MRGILIHEWHRLFSGRSKWVHLAVHLTAMVGIAVIADPFEAERVLVLEANARAVAFAHGVNDLVYLLSMVYALWLSGRLFLRQDSDIVLVHRGGRLPLMALRWGLASALLVHQVVAAWLVAFILFQCAPYHAPGHLDSALIVYGTLFSLQGLTLFSLVCACVKSPHTLGIALGVFFLVDIVRANANRPDALQHIPYITFAILPSIRPSGDGTLVIMASLWLTMLMHGLLIIILSIRHITNEY